MPACMLGAAFSYTAADVPHNTSGGGSIESSTAPHQQPSRIMAVVPQKPMTLISSVLQEGGQEVGVSKSRA